MHVHLERVLPNAFVGRGYDDLEGFEKRLQFRLVFLGIDTEPGAVHLIGALKSYGSVSPLDLQCIARALIAAGYTTAYVERHGRPRTWNLARRLKMN